MSLSAWRDRRRGQIEYRLSCGDRRRIFKCQTCGKNHVNTDKAHNWRRMRCVQCSYYAHLIFSMMGGIMNVAKNRNAVAPLRGLKCVDCKRKATVYDHRRYLAPLVVEPVCHKCNTKRGQAVDMKEAIEVVKKHGVSRLRDISRKLDIPIGELL